jgi:hypothetical protein
VVKMNIWPHLIIIPRPYYTHTTPRSRKHPVTSWMVNCLWGLWLLFWDLDRHSRSCRRLAGRFISSKCQALLTHPIPWKSSREFTFRLWSR